MIKILTIGNRIFSLLPIENSEQINLNDYTIEGITVLRGIDGIRKRPAMYIGSINRFSGLEEMINGLFLDQIPLNESLIDVKCEIYNEKRFKIEITNCDFSISEIEILNPANFEIKIKSFSISILIALSQEIKISLFKKDKTIELNAIQGDYKTQITSENNNQEKLILDFQLDLEIFKDLQYNYELICKSLRKYAFLYPNFKITVLDYTQNEFQQNIYHFPNGTLHQLEYLSGEINPNALHFHTQIGDCEFHISFSLENRFKHIETYVNNNSLLGGSFLKGILKGIKKGFLKYNNFMKKDDFRSLILVASVKSESFPFEFEGSCKDFISNLELETEMKTFISKEFYDYLCENKERADRIASDFR